MIWFRDWVERLCVRCKDRLSQLKKSGDVMGARQGHIPTSFGIINWDLWGKLGGEFTCKTKPIIPIMPRPQMRHSAAQFDHITALDLPVEE